MSKTVAIMQPYLFPYIGYFQLIAVADVFVIYDDVNYINKGWVNRNNILMNGQASLFTVPLKGASQNLLINQIELGDFKTWSAKFLKTIEQTYKKAPEFEATLNLLQNIFQQEFQYIHELNRATLIQICSYLEIKTKIIPSSSTYNNQILKAQERILDICLQEKATQYINAIGGQSLYDKTIFADNGINLHFIQNQGIEYKQFKDNFVPYLSILDVLMFNAKHQVQEFLQAYNLV